MGGGGGSDKYAKQAAAEEARRKGEIKKGTADIRSMFAGQFDSNFYDKIRSDYSNFYTPQFEKQSLDAGEALTGALSGAGHLRGSAYAGKPGNFVGGSSTAIDKFADLEEQSNIQRTLLTDRANQAAINKKRDIQNAQENVVLQLQSTADASGATADAASRLNYLSEAPAYEPLGQLFTDATYGLATQADLERRGQSKYTTGLFPSNSGSSGQNITG